MKPYYEDEKAGIVIYHGDCREVLPQLSNGSIRLIWTDPPYGLSFNDDDLAHRREQALGKLSVPSDPRPITGDDPTDYEALLTNVLSLCGPVCVDCCCCCCCCGGGGPRPRFAQLALWMDRPPWSFFHAVVWRKRGLGLGWHYRRNYEFVMVAHKRNGKLAWFSDRKDISNVIDTRRIIPSEQEHPTPKPVELIEYFIGLHSQPGDLVLDPFMGTGPTLEAAKLMGRRAIGIEIEERYCEMAVRRLRQEVLPFAQVESAERSECTTT